MNTLKYGGRWVDRRGIGLSVSMRDWLDRLQNDSTHFYSKTGVKPPRNRWLKSEAGVGTEMDLSKLDWGYGEPERPRRRRRKQTLKDLLADSRRERRLAWEKRHDT